MLASLRLRIVGCPAHEQDEVRFTAGHQRTSERDDQPARTKHGRDKYQPETFQGRIHPNKKRSRKTRSKPTS
jgi:hypothetical protein|uniref:Uncharacterized protein n=2 Tax=Picea TaxID=3328 RepID=A0A101LYV9_PICGL|nr:hypothetical protein ABT39_MTgene4786 [Picea glauca]QHR91678.1 hypothetical protein Q903MT_gene5714 [Picea sitchensis]